jgi:molybdenum cofactor cytidylyltransferase
VIAAVILAAGASRRMGQPKLVLPWHDGKKIIDHVVTIYRTAGASPIVVVSGEEDDILAAAVTDLNVRRVSVPSGGEMLSSVQAGLSALQEPEVEAALLAPGDHPLLVPETVGRLIDAWRAESGGIVAPSIDGRRGHPILVGRSAWPAILSLRADRSLRDFMRARAGEIRYVVVEDQGVIRDIDTPLDYERALAEADRSSDDVDG